jgi:hypothetical protein
MVTKKRGNVVSIKEPVTIDQPVEEVLEVQQAEVPAEPVETDAEITNRLFSKHSQRGQLASEIVRAILGRQGKRTNNEENLVEYSFSIADRLLVEIEKSNQRGQLTAELVKVILGREGNRPNDADELVEYALSVNDKLQEEIDRLYNSELKSALEKNK